MSQLNEFFSRFVVIFFIFAVSVSLICNQLFVEANDFKNSKQKDINRKSIVFDIKTPKVFYCPQEKQSDHNKMIVKAKPLEKLCEFGGKPKPKGSPSDCYNDVDETDYACDEKRRFLLRLDAADSEQVTTTTQSTNFDDQEDLEFIISKGPNKKKASYPDKKY